MVYSADPTDAFGEIQPNWSFVQSVPSLRDRASRVVRRSSRRDGPPSREIISVTPHSRWFVYFLYLPPGSALNPSQMFTMKRVSESGIPLLVVCACEREEDVPSIVMATAGAVIWKGLGGFDFSAYSIALHAIARASEGADVFVMNDSVFGPFCDVADLFAIGRWDLTGMTAYGAVENHIQTFAFLIKTITSDRLHDLYPVLSREHAYSDYRSVVMMQETRLARVAARTMSVGALWFSPSERVGDASLIAAEPLLDAGLPFIKRALFGKHRDLGQAEHLAAALAARGHPLP